MSPRGSRAIDGAAGSVQLYLLRHADAGDPAAWSRPDAERPLSGKGRRQAGWVGRWLRRQGRLPEVVITSPKVRAAETAALATEEWKQQPVIDDRLASGFGIEELLAVLAERAPDASRVMLVGHDPDFSDLASVLIGAAVALKKGALARIDFAGSPEAGAGALRWLVPAEAVAES
jgi:phosphohistidine phosphatase